MTTLAISPEKALQNHISAITDQLNAMNKWMIEQQQTLREDDVDWAVVGSAAKVKESLNDILARLQLTEFY